MHQCDEESRERTRTWRYTSCSSISYCWLSSSWSTIYTWPLGSSTDQCYGTFYHYNLHPGCTKPVSETPAIYLMLLRILRLRRANCAAWMPFIWLEYAAHTIYHSGKLSELPQLRHVLYWCRSIPTGSCVACMLIELRSTCRVHGPPVLLQWVLLAIWGYI